MLLRARLLAVAAAGAAFLTNSPPSRADAGSAPPPHMGLSPAEQARRAAVVARVGSRAITVGELEGRIATVPRYQLSAFGDTPDGVRRRFLHDVVVPEVLYALAAEDRHLDRDPPTAQGLERALSNATMRAARSQVVPAAQISMDDVRAYYDANKGRFDTPERYLVWRILCGKREEAVAVIEAAKKDLSVQNFTALARDHSIDKATSMRAGNQGFVNLDGTSNEAGLKVDPLVAKAAASVKDGELVPQPVPEGSNFAVVWHRSTVPANHRTAEDTAAQIRDMIWRDRVEAATKGLVEELRAREVRELNEGLINTIEVSPSDGDIVPRHRPGQVPPLAQVNRPTPKPPQQP